MPTPTPRASALDRLVGHRLGQGWTPALQRELDRAGGPRAWVADQLAAAGAQPVGGPLDAFHDASRGWWPLLELTPAEVVRRSGADPEALQQLMPTYQRWVLARRIHGRSLVHETVTEVLENHLHVPFSGTALRALRVDYGAVVRGRALGSFADLLHACTVHPAMQLALDGAGSTSRSPNENLGRELLELHTVGRAHTEADVKAMARLLTGFRVDRRTGDHGYDPGSHATGPVTVLGLTEPNGDRDGRAALRRVLDHLARHPATARRVAHRFATALVSDAPSPALLDHLAAAYLAAGTSVAPVVQALVDHPEFAASEGRKLRTPDQDVVATYRALGVRLLRPTSEASAANLVLWQARDVGHRPFDWPSPDGRPSAASAWSGTARMLASFDVHWRVAGQHGPGQQVVHRRPASWLPGPSTRFDVLVDHVCRSLTGRPADAGLVRACALATGSREGERITAGHTLVRRRWGRLLSAVLDSPAFLLT